MNLRFAFLYIRIFTLPLIFLIPSKLYSQSQKGYNNHWELLNSKLKSGQLADSIYLKQIDSLITSSPVFMGDKSLKNWLSNFKEIAFSKKKFHQYRINYYDYLSENAYMQNLAGVCIYYAEKKEEELKKVHPYINSLSLVRRQYSIYSRIRGGDKFSGTKTYQKILPFLEWLPEGIKKGSVPVLTIRNAFLILQSQTNIFAYQKDSANATKVKQLADKMLEATVTKFKNDIELTQRIFGYYYIIREYEMRAKLNYAEAIPFVMQAKEISNRQTNGKTQLWKVGLKNNSLIHLVDIFLEYKKIDSASKYLDSLKAFEEKALSGIIDRVDILAFTSRLMALKGDYKSAYDSCNKLLILKDSVFAERTVDINNNLYAQTQSEAARDELEKTKSQKRQLYITISGIVLLLITIVSFLLNKMRRKEKEIQQQIYDLNIAGELQIEELKEQNKIAKHEEQRRLGMELHDGLAGNIAFLKTKIELEIIKTTSIEFNKTLSDISTYISALYDQARNKSHKWYNDGALDYNSSFKKRIQTLISNALPEKKFKKNIDIEDKIVQLLPLNVKIEILYIIQEALTNILKHANADMIDLLIYEDIDNIVLQIKDNGKGFDSTIRKKGIGLNSIENRVQQLKGLLTVLSDKKGTEIRILIPVDLIEVQ